MESKYISIGQLNRYIKYKMDNDINLQNVYLKGEISNFKAHTRGHFYFTLKDEESRINAIMFHTSASKVKFIPQDGTKVLISGKINVYVANGAYQIYVDEMLEDGVGNLYIAFEQLKKKLKEEGLFDSIHKKKIPKIPSKIGVVTAPTGAAIRDITSTIRRRWPLAEVILFPALVQGEFAKDSVSMQIKRADAFELDVLIVGRGGGSIEDLWCFNEEIVARTIFNAKTPIISAVGHEVDFTIADFVSDMRAPTPTGAAEMAVPSRGDVESYLSQLSIRLNKVMQNKITIRKQKLEQIMSRSIFKNPIRMYEVKEQQFSNLLDKLKYNIVHLYNTKNNQYERLMQSILFKEPLKLIEKSKNRYLITLSKLETLSPILTIKRGYSVARKNNKIIKSVSEVQKNDLIEIEVCDGKIKTEVV
ncbi:MAG: exodeoxyribonuclease VII large subunit [Bacilli bacterium]|nr:exodeoxyribonuclease VII large subunit [Bacilli bacterium]